MYISYTDAGGVSVIASTMSYCHIKSEVSPKVQ